MLVQGINRIVISGIALALACGGALAVESSGRSLEATGKHFLLGPQPGDLPLLEFSGETLKQARPASGTRVSTRGKALVVETDAEHQRMGLTLYAGEKPWDLSQCLYLAFDCRNLSVSNITLVARAQDPAYENWHHFSEVVVRVPAGKSTTVLIFLKRKSDVSKELMARFEGMHGLPNGYMPIWNGMDPERINQLVLSFETGQGGGTVEIERLRGVGLCSFDDITAPGFMPFVDAFGQYRYGEWKDKVRSQADLLRLKEREKKELAAAPRISNWNEYGGWADGPRLEATGHFRVEKLNGKWWLVDPAGCLFWSHGVTGIGIVASTSVKGARRDFFSSIDHAVEDGKSTLNFLRSNLRLKYGENAERQVLELAHARLESWGMNTMAAWSSGEATSQRRTPYTATLSLAWPALAPGVRLPDPYDPAFLANVQKALAQARDNYGDDPYCIGFFIANELQWSSAPDVLGKVLTEPAGHAAKEEFIRSLQARHSSIETLNAAWKTSYRSWMDLREKTDAVTTPGARKDYDRFLKNLAERYYSLCQQELKRVMPHKLNLGSRFHTGNVDAIRAASRHCDVVSFNKYATSVRGFRMPEGLDKPVIIGEFHFAAWDRSYTAHGKRSVLGQAQRGDGYWYYVSGALENPAIVGTHWFQYLDQPITGRNDGENWPVGFVDITDTPYEDLTAAARELGEALYLQRYGPAGLTIGQGAPKVPKPAPGG